MQSIKMVMRQVGYPNKEFDVISPEDFSEYVAYQFPDHKLDSSHYLGEVKNTNGSVIGYKMMLVLTKDEETRAKVK